MSKALATKNVAAVLLGLGLVLALSFSFATPAKADVISDLQAQVQALLAQITALQGSSSMTSGAGCHVFTENHSLGNSGGEVMWIQQFLNGHGATVAASGAGSPGNETSHFGARTKAAVVAFQNANAATVLTPAGLSSGTGYWGAFSRAKANAICSVAVTPGPNPTPTPTPTPTGPGITVAAGTQPANSLAPQGAVRVPFTTFTLTNNTGAAVTVTNVTVQRTGLGQDAAFAGIVLVDENNLQIGTAKTLNSNHQALVGDPITLNPGQTKTITVAGNMAAALTSYSGQVISLSVVGINTSAAVSGSLPITGASQTINSTLTIGTVTSNISTFDPNSIQSKNIGDTNVKFTGVKFTAGSAEDLKLYSVRFRQVGSVASGDISNVIVVVGGTSYPATVSSNGSYYTVVFPGGILILKGNATDVYLQGDLSGSNSSGRNAEFDIDKTSDVFLVGQLYGYGVAPAAGSGTVSTAATHGSLITTAQPWFQGSTFAITGASVTTIGKANEVAAQNIAANVSNQPLGGFVVDLKGEPISVQSMIFSIATTSTGPGLLTNVSVVDSNGAVVAGPVDASGAGTTLTFTDTVTFPTGRHVYSLKGKVPSAFTNNGTIVISSTPSSQWTTVTGQITGNTITLTNGAFSMNTMTVKAASLAVAVSATPSAQNIVAGGQGIVFANYQFDASQSGEDVRFSSLTLDYNNAAMAFAAASSKLSSCQLWDGATALNTGANVVNPSTTATTTTPTTGAFTLDNSVTISKGTIKTLALACNIATSADASSTMAWGITSTHIAAIAATGITSSNSVTPTSASGGNYNGQMMSITTGSLAVSTDASSPSYAVTAANSTGSVLGVAKFRATNEGVNLNRIGLILTNSASSSASDLTQVTLWAGGVQIGTATFVGAQTHATSTLASVLALPKDTDVQVTIKGNVASIGTSQPGTSGHVLAVDVEANTNTQGTGTQSGLTINSTGSSGFSGVRTFKSFPTLAKDTVPTNILNNGTQALLRFKVTANSNGDIGIAKFTLVISTTTASVTSVNVYAFTDPSYSTPVSGISSDGGMSSTTFPAATYSYNQLDVAAQTSAGASTTVQVPANQTRYFEVRGTVTGTAAGTSVSTNLQGDAAYPSLPGFMATFNSVNADTHNDFIWSPNSTTTAATGDFDWTNGFGLVGLPASNMSNEVLSK